MQYIRNYKKIAQGQEVQEKGTLEIANNLRILTIIRKKIKKGELEIAPIPTIYSRNGNQIQKTNRRIDGAINRTPSANGYRSCGGEAKVITEQEDEKDKNRRGKKIIETNVKRGQDEITEIARRNGQPGKIISIS